MAILSLKQNCTVASVDSRNCSLKGVSLISCGVAEHSLLIDHEFLHQAVVAAQRAAIERVGGLRCHLVLKDSSFFAFSLDNIRIAQDCLLGDIHLANANSLVRNGMPPHKDFVQWILKIAVDNPTAFRTSLLMVAAKTHENHARLKALLGCDLLLGDSPNAL